MSDKREAYKDRNSTLSALESALKTKIKINSDMRTTIATKFVAWEVPTLESLRNSKVYRLRAKLKTIFDRFFDISSGVSNAENLALRLTLHFNA